MPQNLSAEDQEEIYRTLQKTFSDFPLFNSLVATKLRQAIDESCTIDINIKTTRKVVERYFSTDVFKTPEQKNALAQIQIIFKTCYTLILSYHDSSKALLWPSVEVLLDNYPQFVGQDQEELEYLLNFRNFMKVALIIVPARLNKQCLLKICARLEGSQNEYVTGGGQKPCVTRRVDIYEKEGNAKAEKRPDRPERPVVAVDSSSDLSAAVGAKTTGGKRKNGGVGPAYCSVSTIKQSRMTRLPSDDIRQLLHHSNPEHSIPPLYQTQQQRQVDETLQGLLGLKNQPTSTGSFSGVNGTSSSSSGADFFDSVPLMPPMFRGETDMLIATCGLLSSASDMWGEELGIVNEKSSDGAVSGVANHASISACSSGSGSGAGGADTGSSGIAFEDSSNNNNSSDMLWNSMETSSSSLLRPPEGIARGFSDIDGLLFTGAGLTEDLRGMYDEQHGGVGGGSITEDLKALYG